MLLRNKSAVVTGCNRGIGKAIIENFAKNGANIWACIRKKDIEFSNFNIKLEIGIDLWTIISKPLSFFFHEDFDSDFESDFVFPQEEFEGDFELLLEEYLGDGAHEKKHDINIDIIIFLYIIIFNLSFKLR